MERSHTPLSTWFWAAYLVASQTQGMSAVQFQRQLGLTRYETAFQILHKLRAGMVRPHQDRIGGRANEHVEVGRNLDRRPHTRRRPRRAPQSSGRLRRRGQECGDSEVTDEFLPIIHLGSANGIYKPTSTNSRFGSTGASTRSTPSVRCSASLATQRRRPMPSFIPATGITLHLAGVCVNRIGVQFSLGNNHARSCGRPLRTRFCKQPLLWISSQLSLPKIT